MSGDPKEDYFSDGITEDIITELSRFSELFVIARNSSIQYKGKSPDIRQVGRELGVRYVVEGSIRRAGNRVRVTGQLIDASTGVHRWAERYDRKLEDVFAVQGEVVRDIVTALTAQVNNAEVERRLLKPPATWQAHDYYLRAKGMHASFRTSFRVQELYECRALLEHALAVDPKYAHALALLADTYASAFLQPLDKDYRACSTLERAHQIARSAVQLVPNSPDAHATLGNVLTYRQEHDASLRKR
jgi:adenylate cyclase